MKLILALGNPGPEYALTRHNAGWLAATALVAKLKMDAPRPEKKFNAEIADGLIGKEKIILAQPLTFMNKSGAAAGALAKFYKIKPENIFVLHDDKDIALGKYKIQTNRGPAGHNGVISVMKALKTQNFTRLRLGTAPASGKTGDAAEFVLKKFNKNDLAKLNEAIGRAIEEICLLIKRA